MRRRSMLESYALVVCFEMLICCFVALYYLGLGIISREAPEYTINRWTYGTHQTNERYWGHANLGDRRPRPPEEALTAERERSWRAELQLERRDGTRFVWMSSLGFVVSLLVLLVHWRVARKAKREERGTEREERGIESDAITRPLVLASVMVFGFGCCFSTGLAGVMLAFTGGNYNSRYDEETRLVAPILGADSAFAEVEIHPLSSGGISLSGVVPTELDLERLRAQVERALGERRGQDATRGVQVRRAASEPSR